MIKNKTDNGNIVHIFGWDKKFTPSFIEFIEKNFDSGKHQFIIFNSKSEKNNRNPTIFYYKSKLSSVFKSFVELNRSKQIIIHGLYFHLVIILFINPWLLKKTCWVIWGADLYYHKLGSKKRGFVIKELLRSFVIKRLKCITTTIPGDYRLANLWYKTDAVYIQNLMYKSHLHRDQDDYSKAISKTNACINIQIGNSADPSNNHFEIIKKISLLDLTKVSKIYAPLSYGDKNYATRVIEYGENKLGKKFVGILKFMSFDEYNQYLKTIDIAFFNHDRQQAVGNIIALTSLGKKIFLKGSVTTFSYLTSLGLRIFDSEENIEISVLTTKQAQKNIDISKKEFNLEKLINSWERVFSL